MKTTIRAEVELYEILKSVNAEDVASFYVNRDVDEILRNIPESFLIRYLRANNSSEFILDELAEVGDIETHISELRTWEAKRKIAKEVAS